MEIGFSQLVRQRALYGVELSFQKLDDVDEDFLQDLGGDSLLACEFKA